MNEVKVNEVKVNEAKKVAVMDMETDPFKYGSDIQPFAVGFYTGYSYYEFFGSDCVELFVNFLDDLKEKGEDNIIIYAHNGGKFDFHFMIKYFSGEINIINGRISKFYIKGIEFRDSFLLLPKALSAYKKDEIDYSIFKKKKRYKPCNFNKIKAYLKTDCIYLYEWIILFKNRFGNPLTLASASFFQLKKTGYDITRSGIRYDKKFRDFYFGGRCEVFEGGNITDDIEYYDINSAYPSAMLQSHPHGNIVNELDYLPEGSNYFARIRAISRGCLPLRGRDGSLSFPNDFISREYFATGWEINAGLETNTLDIEDVLIVYSHIETSDFKSFVIPLYDERKEKKISGDDDMAGILKLISNAGYGKFALNSRKFKKYEVTVRGLLPDELVVGYIKYNVDNVNDYKRALIYDDNLSDKECDNELLKTTWEIVNDIEGLTIWERDAPGKSFYNVATAASITGCVRSFLWRSICKSDGVFYVDTDSIMCRKFNGIKSDKLGDWGLECIFDELYIGGKKLYAGHIKGKKRIIKKSKRDNRDWKKASKGSRLGVREIIDIIKYNKTVNWKNEAPSFSFKSAVKYIDRNIKNTL